MQSPAPCLRLIFRIFGFDIFVLPLYYFFGGSLGSLGPSTASERRVTIHSKYAGIGVLASYGFPIWPFLEFLKSALLLFWGPGWLLPSHQGKKIKSKPWVTRAWFSTFAFVKQIFSVRPMATAYLKVIMNDASESLVNMQSPTSCTRLIFRFCDFVIFLLPLYYFFGGSWVSLGSSTASERQVPIQCKYAGIGVLASCEFPILPFF